MVLKMSNYRLNHNFQILYFQIGSKHTPDAAYSFLCDQINDRKHALMVNLIPQKLRGEAKLQRSKWKSWSPFKAHRLEAQADFEEVEIFKESNNEAIEACKAEIAFIEECMRRLEPHRKYAHLPLAEAHEAAQQEEWKLELIDRAKNNLITTGQIPSDQFKAMSLHPEFKSSILPAIEQTRQLLMQGPDGYNKVLEQIGKTEPLLLTHKE